MMAAKLSHADLLHVSKGDAKTINHFRLGVRLSQISGLAVLSGIAGKLKTLLWLFAGLSFIF
jgi:hypothetical protein